MKCSVFAPSHITGFFEIKDNKEPLKKGSRGAGIALDKGVVTNLQLTEKDSPNGSNIEVTINGEKDQKNTTITHKTMEIMEAKYKINHLLHGTQLKIDHKVDVPIGAGFGISAACAIGTALGITKLLQLNLTYNQATSIAHLAEIEMQSGLGDVVAEVNGGITLRIKEGAPGVGVLDKLLPKNKDLYILCKSLGCIETSEIIGDPGHKERINQTGGAMLNQLLLDPVPKTFLKLSKKFAENTKLMTPEISEIIAILQEETMGASMAMLGNTAFAISKTPETSIENVIVSRIDEQGCRYI
ncbi:GHMP kinase [Methanobacterium lacus]|uniref:Pantoate kinase n=1 Tax=Methanobacterium lacus (strain AL-21) TaxID=877455 RepID=F0TBZ9_METLA|nr:pantoate kinase [Methanobacterium lacus]ADZ10341.1 GHMP kinase [Methanobacterium lacus]